MVHFAYLRRENLAGLGSITLACKLNKGTAGDNVVSLPDKNFNDPAGLRRRNLNDSSFRGYVTNDSFLSTYVPKSKARISRPETPPTTIVQTVKDGGCPTRTSPIVR